MGLALMLVLAPDAEPSIKKLGCLALPLCGTLATFVRALGLGTVVGFSPPSSSSSS